MSSCANCSAIIIDDLPCIACGSAPVEGAAPTAKTEPPAKADPATRQAAVEDTGGGSAFVVLAGVLVVVAVVGVLFFVQ